MARNSKEKDSTYNKAYYERLKADPKRRAERTKKSVARKVQKNYEERVKKWEEILSVIRGMQAQGATDHEIAESYAKDYILKKTTKSKWIDFSPLSSKSLSSSLSSSSAARPARTQAGNPYLRFPILPSEDLKIDGHKCYIRNNLNINTSAYVRIPEDNKFYLSEPGLRSISDYPVYDDTEVSGGVTFYGYVPKERSAFLPEGCYVGWDYAHVHDLGRKLTREEVVEDIKNAIRSVKKGERGK